MGLPCAGRQAWMLPKAYSDHVKGPSGGCQKAGPCPSTVPLFLPDVQRGTDGDYWFQVYKGRSNYGLQGMEVAQRNHVPRWFSTWNKKKNGFKVLPMFSHHCFIIAPVSFNAEIEHCFQKWKNGYFEFQIGIYKWFSIELRWILSKPVFPSSALSGLNQFLVEWVVL